MSENANRCAQYDMMKGFLILLVVLAHNAKMPDMARELIGYIVIPTFLLLAGMFFRHASEEPLTQFSLRMLRSLVVPYFFFALLSFPFYGLSVWVGDEPLVSSAEALLSFVRGKPFTDRPLWFLVSLGMSQVLLWMCLRIRIGRLSPVAFWGLIGLVCIGCQLKMAQLPVDMRDSFLLRVCNLPFCFLMLSLGFFLRDGIRRLQETRLSWIDSLVVAGVCAYLLRQFAFVSPVVAVDEGLLASPSVYATSVIGFVMVFGLCRVVGDVRFLGDALGWIGRNSLFLFALEGGVAGPFARLLLKRYADIGHSWTAVMAVLLVLVVITPFVRRLLTAVSLRMPWEKTT